MRPACNHDRLKIVVMSFNPRWEAAPRATPAHAAPGGSALSDVSIPDGKPPHVRPSARAYSHAPYDQVSIPDGKPPHVRLHATSYLRRSRDACFNPRWEAAPRATCRYRRLAVTLHDEFQSQMGSRPTCDRAIGCQIAACYARFNPRWEAAPRATRRCAGSRATRNDVSIPDGKPPHVRPHVGLRRRCSTRMFQSQMGSRPTCD